MKQLSILIVDDDPDNFDVLETLLSSSSSETVTEPDYQLYYAASGREAIENLSIFQPDLILLDVMMPEMDGIETCRRIKAMSKWQNVPIIMVTALSEKSDLARCLNAGADDFISKPVNSIELRSRVRSMLRIKKQYDELQSLIKFREDMVKTIVHDLRNPLTHIAIGLELLLNTEYPPEKQKKKLSKIYLSTQRTQKLVGNLLDISLFEAGKIKLDRTEVYLDNIIKSSMLNLKDIATQKNQSLVIRYPKESKKTVSVDVDLIQRVFDNLISNAIKFSPENSQIVARLECLKSEGSRIQVIDSGPGVPDSLQEKIFETYEVGTLMPGISQIGLGLAFCKMVVAAHGGTITVKNRVPQGAIFEIALPNYIDKTIES
ncbi:MAG: response regulator [Cyanobacteria bacterium SID2]|nr:response regulator [Cyanobacteria bacterium SID2]MBP0005985.1 response regulator [Cyanobacteria bacterium SBC]